MKAKKIWIAQHPDQLSNFEVMLTCPNDSGVYLYSNTRDGEDQFVEWKECVIIEVES